MGEKQPIRVLIIAEAANPEWTSVPLVGWSHAKALAEVVDAHVVTQVRNRDAIVRAGWTEGKEFTAIDSEKVARPLHKLSSAILPKGKAWTAGLAISVPAYYYFERLVWKQFGERIRSGEFDLVHRLTPLSPTMPSLIARKCRRAGVPFVWGPINGGVPWPKGFDSTRRQELELLSYVRDAYKLLPGYRSTRRNSAAIIVGSRDTENQLARWCRDKAVYIPENGIDPSRFNAFVERPVSQPLRVAFVGRLVPYKGADMLIEAAAPLVRSGQMEVHVFGDGPELPKLQSLVASHKVKEGVHLHGWVPHMELQDRLLDCDVFGFPSIREFGGGVVLEAMAVGLVPVVVDYAGPGELVTEGTGFKVAMGSRKDIIAGFRQAFEGILANPAHLRKTGRRARDRVLECLTWQAKAKQVLEVYERVLGHAAVKV